MIIIFMIYYGLLIKQFSNHDMLYIKTHMGKKFSKSLFALILWGTYLLDLSIIFVSREPYIKKLIRLPEGKYPDGYLVVIGIF